MENNNALGQVIIELRKKNNISQKELAKKISVSASTLCKWEHGVNIPDLDSIKLLADTLEIPVENLIHAGDTLVNLQDPSILPVDVRSESDNGVSNDKKRKKYWIKGSIIACAIILFFALGIAFIYHYQKPTFRIKATHYMYDTPYGTQYTMTVLCKPNTSYEDASKYADWVYEEWLNGKFTTEIPYSCILLDFYDSYGTDYNVIYDVEPIYSIYLLR